jgi:hypothetical protein
MNSYERQQMIERLRESSAEIRADLEAREQALIDDPLVYDDYIRDLCSEPLGASVVRSAEAAAGLVYKRNERALVSPAVAAQADVDDVGEMSLEELLDTVGECLGLAAAEERAERRKLQDRLRKRIAKLERRIDALESERTKVLNLPVRHVG